MNEDATKEKGRNDTFSEVMGEESNGQVRLYGFDVCPSLVWKDTSNWKQNCNEYVDTLQSELNDLRSRVQNLTEALSHNQHNNNDIPILQVNFIFYFYVYFICKIPNQ